MSQEDRNLSHGVPQLEDPFVFLAQRRSSCRCGSSSPNDDNDETTITEDSQLRVENKTMESSIDEFVVDIDSVESREHDDNNRNETMNLDNEIRTCEIEKSVETKNNDDPSILKYNVEPDEECFPQIIEKSRCSSDYCENADLVDDDLDQFIYEPRGRSSNPTNCQIPSVHMTRTQTRLTNDFSPDEIDGDDEIDDERLRDRSSIIDSRNIACLTETRSSPSRINDERPSTAGSSISFATSCSSANETTNNTRVHGRHDSNVNENVLNRSQTNTKLHQQLPIIMNAFNANRSNQRSSRGKRCNDDDHHEIDDTHRINSNTGNVSGVTYSPGFRNLHNEHIIQPLHRGNNVIAKGTFDNIQVTRSTNTMEKGKCQCHHIQQHQNQQMLSQIQQRDTGHQHLHHHHHHHHQQSQQQQQHQQHRHKTTQQPSQQQQQYRHNHYHHPHQHIGQQQEHQRSQNDQNAGRKQRNGSETDDESNEMMETGLGNHQPPALPPRPPPRPNRRYEENAITAYDLGPNNGEDAGCCKKYVVLCCLCGGLSAAVGSLFLAVHAVLSAHTASLALFETVPSYIPGTMLILMGLFTILLARRKHRYGILMKMCGSVGVVCALVCVLVTVTTTVVHMSRLQGLRQCIYTERARSCTCYSSIEGRILTDPGVLFEETPHCEAVHGALYDCLRALFGVSVAGILACIFSCMLLYQLLSHEKKKMYWEQLQLRCRSLYSQGGSGAVGGPTGGSCGCCNDCNGGAGPWWAQTPGNLYTPNPDMAPFSRRWRLPWSRSRGPAPTPDSNYGFNTQSRSAVAMRSSDSSSGEPVDNTPGPYSVLADESQTGGAAYSLLNGPGSTPYAACTSSIASYSLLESGPVPALWGPPPPYSDPNSPARRPQVNVSSTIRPHSTIESSATIPVNMSTNRIATGKRTMDNFDPDSINEEYRQQRGTSKRPSDNYENAEEVLSSSTDPDIDLGNQQQHLHHHHHHHHHTQRQQDEDATKGRRIRKSLKGVENGGFQQESGNPMIKQSESELYFGDVSSCCGPESSFYDLAVDKDQLSVDPSTDSLNEYPSIRGGKQRQSSKRSRLPLPLPSTNPEVSVGSMSENYTPLNNQTVVEDLSRNSSTRGPYLAPDAQYEVIAAQQTRYTYYNPKNGERVLEIPLSSLANISPYRNGNSIEKFDDQRDNRVVDYTNDCSRLSMEQCPNNDGMNVTTMSTTSTDVTVMSVPPSPLSRVSNSNQRCSNDMNGNSRDSLQNELQNQIRTAQSNEIICPVNV